MYWSQATVAHLYILIDLLGNNISGAISPMFLYVKSLLDNKNTPFNLISIFKHFFEKYTIVIWTGCLGDKDDSYTRMQRCAGGMFER